MSKDYWIGGQLTYAGTKATPGLTYMGTNIPITMHNVNLRAVFGYDFHSKTGMRALGRLGYHYDAFLVPVDNKATLPAESLAGFSLGAALDVPQVTNKISFRGSLDAVLGGKRKQTVGLEDGATPSALAIMLGLGGTYFWKNGLVFTANYDLLRVTNSFGAPVTSSKRMHMGTSVSRTDLLHTITAGIRKSF